MCTIYSQGQNQTRKIGRTLPQGALPWGEKHGQKQNGKKRKEKSNHQMGRSSRDWERPPSGGIEVGDVSGEGAPNSYPAPPGGTSVGSDVELRLAFSHLHFRASASCFKFH